MIYVIKFFYSWLLPPGILVLLFAAVFLVAQRRHALGRWRYVLLLGTLLLYLLSIRPGADLLVRPLERWYTPPAEPSGDVILMLGNGSVAGVPDIDGTGQPSGTMAKSMLTAQRLWRQLDVPILVSGGTVFEDTGTEADIALREFRAMGIPEEALFAENRSRNTRENVRFSKEICEEMGWQHPLVLVVAAQAPRTARLFEKAGLEAEIYPTHYRRSPEHHFSVLLDLVPQSSNLDDSALALKEYLGLLAETFH